MLFGLLPKPEPKIRDRIALKSSGTTNSKGEIVFKEKNVKSVLDVGCGFGRISIPLIKQGLDVEGVDSNKNYLEQVKKQITEKGLHPTAMKHSGMAAGCVQSIGDKS